jgi:hypothetical protein
VVGGGEELAGVVAGRTVTVESDRGTRSTLSAASWRSPATVSTGQTGGVNDSSVAATVTNAGSPVVGDTLAVTATPSTAGSCGTIPATGVTGAGGTVTLAYVGTAVVGTCTIKVTEADNGLSGTAVITQAANNSVVVATGGTAIAPHTVVESTGGGVVPNVLSATVTTPAAAPVVGETINFTLTPETSGGCGTLTAPSEVTAAGGIATDVVSFAGVGTPTAACGTFSPASAGSTNSSGVVSVTYTSSTTAGFCTITATENGTAQTGTVTIDQTRFSLT